MRLTTREKQGEFSRGKLPFWLGEQVGSEADIFVFQVEFGPEITPVEFNRVC